MNTWEWIKEHSTLVLLLVGGLLVGILFLKKTPPQVAISPLAGADLSGLAMDASGHPIVYRAVSDTFITENISGSYNTAAQDATQNVGTAVNSPTTTSTSTTTTTDNHSTPIEHPIEPQPTVHPTDGLLGPSIEFIPPASYRDPGSLSSFLPLLCFLSIYSWDMNSLIYGNIFFLDHWLVFFFTQNTRYF